MKTNFHFTQNTSITSSANLKTRLLISLIVVSICSGFLTAQDAIEFLNGNTLETKVEQVGQSEVLYKRFDNLNGPTYSVDKAGIKSIQYENGVVDKFSVPSVIDSKTDEQIRSVTENLNPNFLDSKERNFILYNNDTRTMLRKFEEADPVDITYTSTDGSFHQISGHIIDIRSDNIMVNKEIIPLTNINTVKHKRGGRKAFNTLGDLTGLVGLFMDDPAMSAVSLGLHMCAWMIPKKVPVGGKFQVAVIDAKDKS